MNTNEVKKFTLTALGIAIMLLGVVAFYRGISDWGLSGILWFSYTALFLIGLGILLRSSYLISSQLNIIFIPYLFWNVDFLYVLFTGNSLWGVTNYFFESRPFLAQLISAQHIFIIPLSLLAIYFIKIKRKDFWILSLAQVAIFFFLIRIFSDESLNVNCAFENCIPLQTTPALYPLGWFAAYLLMIVLTTLFLTKIKAFNKP